MNEEAQDMFIVSDRWKTTCPDASVGILTLHGVSNPGQDPALNRNKADLEAQLRARYAGLDRAALKAMPAVRAYAAYYRRFDKSYHVQLQLEAVVWKGKPIPSGAALVEAMFMAELADLLLTAGHDLAAVQAPVTFNVALGNERFVRINGEEQQLKAGDLFIADTLGVLSSVLYGPDQRTQLRPETREVLFTTYAPPGIGEEMVRHHLETIRDNVRVFAPNVQTGYLAVYGHQ
jgi:DNA/RNA-binding domain of Phe-tRNA-synthetase-like protein